MASLEIFGNIFVTY